MSRTKKPTPIKSAAKLRSSQDHLALEGREKAQLASAKINKPVQFNWRRHWSKKVAPYLNEELVQTCLDLGMILRDPNWQRGDAPCEIGAIGFTRVVKGKLSWYQPLNRCHYIAFFAIAIGVLNYPDLDWKFVSGDVHTVPVGYDSQGNPRVVMDILLFGHFTAEESIAHTQKVIKKLKPSEKVRKGWEAGQEKFVTVIVPLLRQRAQELRQHAVLGTVLNRRSNR
jgi:hypothetical protein